MPLILLQFTAELHKLFARRRTWIGFAVFVAIEVIILLLLQMPVAQASFRRFVEANGYGFDKYYSGITLAFNILAWTIFLLGSLYLAMVAGDVVSKEVEEGTMRMMLCRPVSRVRLLALKYFACVLYTVVLVNFVGLTALLAGGIRQGFGGGLLAWLPAPESLFAIHDFHEGFIRYLWSLQTLSLSLLTVTSLAFMLSCFDTKPVVATIVAVSYILADSIFRNMPYFESIRQWLLTTHMAAWFTVFKDPVPYWDIVRHYAYLLGVDGTFVVVGMVAFSERDLKS